MSTKIYDAYKFDKKYNLSELNNIFDELRKECNTYALSLYSCELLKYFIYLKDLSEILEKEDNKKYFNKIIDPDYLKVFDYFKKGKMILAFTFVENIMRSEISDFCECNYYDYFKANLCIYPIRGKILALYTGNKDIQNNVIKNQNYLLDYHYQNQTDRPENISKTEWNKRDNDWNKAIGPDYIPSQHGFQVSLVNKLNLDFLNAISFIKNDINLEKYSNMFNLCDSDFQDERAASISSRLNENTPFFTELKEKYPDKNNFQLYRTEEYKKFIKKTEAKIKSNLQKYTIKDIVSLLKN